MGIKQVMEIELISFCPARQRRFRRRRRRHLFGHDRRCHRRHDAGQQLLCVEPGLHSRGDHRVLPGRSADHAPALLRKLMAVDLPEGTFLNLNFPNCAPEEVEGTEVTAQGTARLQSHGGRCSCRRSRFLPYYWLIRRARQRFREHDVSALKNRKISVTPLTGIDRLFRTGPRDAGALMQVNRIGGVWWRRKSLRRSF